MENLLSDTRFAHVARDPKFRRIPKAERKVKIDKRFQSMFKDKKFNVKYTIDKRGRPVNQTSTENLRKYYDISDSENESADEVEDSMNTVKTKKENGKQKTKKENKKLRSKQSKKSSNDLENGPHSDKDHDDNSDQENCPSSNGSLLLIKPQDQHDSNSESGKESWDTDTEEVNTNNVKEDLDENERQLHSKIKNEAGRLTDVVKEKLRDLTVNYARGEGILITDSSSDEESSEYSDNEDTIEHNWGELDKEAETTDEITCRLAVCNMDWDRIRAVDLMVLFNSFLPGGGLIHSVTIYPSQFGLERMKEEEVKGPIELVESKKNSQDDDNDDQDDNEEGSNYHMEKLRQYQLNRLKYYYAVVDCDSPETANKIYTECDGVEYESTATKMDLRFIPDDMTFDEEPKEVCNEIPQLSKYQPRQFTTTALQQVKVDLTWDETNPERQEITQKLSSGKIDEVDENDIHAYLASGSSDDEDNKNTEVQEDEAHSDSDTKTDPIAKYKSLLKSIEDQEEAKKQKDVELEFTWGLGTTEKAEKLVKERLKKDEGLTPFEQYLEKRKAKKKAKREERQKVKEGENAGLTDSEDDIPSDIDLSDPYFAELKKAKSKKKKKDASHSKNALSTTDEEKNQQKAELELLLMDKNEDGDKQHFNMKKIEEHAALSKSKKKRLMKKKKDVDSESKEDNFEVNVQDPRFTALFTSHHFNIDPADPHYRKTKGTEALVNEKLKRRADDSVINEVQPKQPKTNKKLNTELQALVKSVKKNAQNISQPIK